MSFVAGLIGGLQGSLMRGMTISVEIGGFFSGITLSYLLLALLASLLQLKSLNISMEVYDQVEIVPIYQSALILLNILCGAIILDEK